MVFPRAVLDKTLVPQLDLQLEAHLVEFFFFLPPFWMWESVVQAVQFALGSASCCWALVYYCFFAFYTPGRPPSSGAHWSVKQSKLQSSHSLTASLQAESRQAGWQERLLQNFSKSKTTPRKYTVFGPQDSPLWCWRFCPQEPQSERVSVIRYGLFMYLNARVEERGL